MREQAGIQERRALVHVLRPNAHLEINDLIVLPPHVHGRFQALHHRVEFGAIERDQGVGLLYRPRDRGGLYAAQALRRRPFFAL